LVTETDASDNTTVVVADKDAVTIAPRQTVARAFSFAVKTSTPTGTYEVSVTTRDVTGSVTQSGAFTVT
jgi:hypothetical protein